MTADKNKAQPLTSTPQNGRSPEFYVAFTSARDLVWWMRPFVWHKDFGHCALIAPMQFVVGVIEPTQNQVKFHCYYHAVAPRQFLNDARDVKTMEDAGAFIASPMDPLEVAKVWVGLGWRVVHYKATVDSERKIYHPSNMVPSCVSLVKAMMGITAWIITPKGLFNWLLRHGGEEITLGEKEKMGGKPKQPDNSKQEAELKRQRDEAQARTDQLTKENLDEVNARRRGRGLNALISTSEFGTKLGQ